MNTSRRGPFIRVGLFIIAAAMLLYMPTREFLKLTFMLGIPFIFVLVFMKKVRKFSPIWFVLLLMLIGVSTGYVYRLMDLPQHIAVRQIVIDGGTLMAAEKYDEAVAVYRQLEAYDIDEMNEKIQKAENDKKAMEQVKKAKQFKEAGQIPEAIKALNDVPEGTRYSSEASSLKKLWVK